MSAATKRAPQMADNPPPAIAPGLRRQMEIYQGGLAGKLPERPVAYEDLEAWAKSMLSPEAYDYVAGGAGSEDTVRANLEAFRRWRIVPRFLRDVGRRDLAVDILGLRIDAPVMLAPIGVSSILHQDADLAVARAARAAKVPLILSTASSATMEDVAKEMADAPRWFQLYWPKNDELAASFLQRAERAGYSAIVVTLDTALLGWRERDLRNAYLPFLKGDGLANYLSDPVFVKAVGGDVRSNPERAIQYFLSIFSDPTRTWKDLERLCQMTQLPVLVKGVLHPDDARRALDHWAAGVIVSNHGGRQLDGAVARSKPCRAWSTRSATAPRSSLTAAFAGVPTSSKRWRWREMRAAWPPVCIRPRHRRRAGGARRACQPDRRYRPNARHGGMRVVRRSEPQQPRGDRLSDTRFAALVSSVPGGGAKSNAGSSVGRSA